MKQPREKVYTSRKPVVKHEFRNCDAPGCPNIVSVEDKPKGYSDPIYCVLHLHLAEKN